MPNTLDGPLIKQHYDTLVKNDAVQGTPWAWGESRRVRRTYGTAAVTKDEASRRRRDPQSHVSPAWSAPRRGAGIPIYLSLPQSSMI